MKQFSVQCAVFSVQCSSACLTLQNRGEIRNTKTAQRGAAGTRALVVILSEKRGLEVGNKALDLEASHIATNLTSS